MQGHRRRRVTRKQVPRDGPQPRSAQRVVAGRHRFLCGSSSAMHTDIASVRSPQTYRIYGAAQSWHSGP